MEFHLGHDALSVQDVVRIARQFQKIHAIDDDVTARMNTSAHWVQNMVQNLGKDTQEQPFYGINTGFGNQAGKSTLRSEELTKLLSRNLIVSHAVGVGPYFDEEIVRAAMLIRAHVLAQGYSGVRPVLVQKLIDMLNQRVFAAVPSQGSLGAGDLAPLAHLALVLSKPPTGVELVDQPPDATAGEAFMPISTVLKQQDTKSPYHITEDRVTGEQTIWQRVRGDLAMQAIGGQIELYAKEGLSLVSGSTFSTAIAALALADTQQLLDTAELAAAMTLEAIKGFRDPFLPDVQNAFGHPGSITAASNIMRYTQGSSLLDGGREHDPERIPPQDPISVRSSAQVLGAARDALAYINQTVHTELNAVTDNPLIFPDLPRDYKTISCGNFQSEALAIGMDLLGIVLTNIGAIAERRIFKLTDYTFTTAEEHAAYGLDAFLIKEPPEVIGLNSGFMIPQYTAAALVSECRTLAHPGSVDTISSSANKEDYVSMSFNAARHARMILQNVEMIIAIELMSAAQALSLRIAHSQEHQVPIQLGAVTGAVLERIRQEIPFVSADRVLYPYMRVALRLIRSGELLRLAQ